MKDGVCAVVNLWLVYVDIGHAYMWGALLKAKAHRLAAATQCIFCVE